MNAGMKAGITRKTGEGRKLNVLGDDVWCKIVASESGGSLTIVEEASTPNQGPPAHIHEREDEAFYVLEGTYEFRLGDKTITLEAGGFVFGPRGVPHGFRNAGNGPGRMLVVVSPSGLEHCFEELNKLPPGPPDISKVFAICKKYGITILAA